MRRALAACSAAGALAAVFAGFDQSWPLLGHHDRTLSPAEAALAAAHHEGLPVALFARWKARLHPGDRWWLEIPAGASEGLTTRGAVYRAFAIYYFLPELPAASKAQATVVFELSRAR